MREPLRERRYVEVRCAKCRQSYLRPRASGGDPGCPRGCRPKEAEVLPGQLSLFEAGEGRR